MAAMGRTGVMRLVVRKEGFELELEREENAFFKPVDQPFETEEGGIRTDLEQRANAALSRGASEAAAAKLPSKVVSPAETKDDANVLYITSPMVGTFYSSPSPEDPTFVKAGDKVDKNSVVCIVEAMKVMNEVKAGVSGIISEALVESGHPVEFGTKLFKITPQQ